MSSEYTMTPANCGKRLVEMRPKVCEWVCGAGVEGLVAGPISRRRQTAAWPERGFWGQGRAGHEAPSSLGKSGLGF